MGSDQQLEENWKEFVSGHPAAFRPIYDHFFQPVFAYCLGKLKQRDQAENATADIFIRVLQYKKLEEVELPENWIFTIARNICLNHLNKGNRRLRIFEEISWQFETVQQAACGQTLDLAYVDEQIRESLKLVDYQIWLLHAEGYDNREIARRLSKNEKTVANRKVEILRKVSAITEKILGVNGKN